MNHPRIQSESLSRPCFLIFSYFLFDLDSYLKLLKKIFLIKSWFHFKIVVYTDVSSNANIIYFIVVESYFLKSINVLAYCDNKV